MRCIKLVALFSTLIVFIAFNSTAQTQNPTAQALATPTPTPLPLPPPTVKIDRYRSAAARIIGAALTSDHAYARLAHLTDHIGNRLSGSTNLERAIGTAPPRASH